MAYSNAEGKNILDASNGVASYTAPTTPIRMRLMTANGTAAAAGTEVSGGSYAAQAVTFSAAGATNQTAVTSAGVNYTNMPSAAVVGVEFYDSSATPRRLSFGSITQVSVSAGNTLTFAPGSVSTALGG